MDARAGRVMDLAKLNMQTAVASFMLIGLSECIDVVELTDTASYIDEYNGLSGSARLDGIVIKSLTLHGSSVYYQD